MVMWREAAKQAGDSKLNSKAVTKVPFTYFLILYYLSFIFTLHNELNALDCLMAIVGVLLGEKVGIP